MIAHLEYHLACGSIELRLANGASYVLTSDRRVYSDLQNGEYQAPASGMPAVVRCPHCGSERLWSFIDRVCAECCRPYRTGGGA